jgi:anaerobic magnesium-protoporphyrin IX monomethyl ester cyclase
MERAHAATPNSSRERSVLIIDLNNFATFPTLAVGVLIANLRGRGFRVRLLSPLAFDVPAAERERAETVADHLARRLHLSTSPSLRGVRDVAREVRSWWINRPHGRVLAEAEKALRERPDVLLLSAYLQHGATVSALGSLSRRYGVPLLLGGPMFNQVEVSDAWRSVPALSAIVGAEADLSVADIVDAVCNGEDLLRFEGITLPDGRRSPPGRPLRPLDSALFPDFSDFPWHRYRVRIVPMMASRGCQWGRCTFCSDVVSVSGRSFRSRSVTHVLDEMREQAARCATSNFLFLDLKLNSSPDLFRGIIHNVQSYVPGAQWIGTVHVDKRNDNGLSMADLRAAAKAGMRRVSFGLESGSQRMLDAMEKGSSVERNSEFIHNAYEAGLSIRCTMFKGYPGETAEDLLQTAEFLEQHAPYLDRIRFNDFSIPLGTPIYRAVTGEPDAYPNLRLHGLEGGPSRARYVSDDGRSASYRRAKARVLRAVYEINRKPLRGSARQFDGLM